MNKIKGFFLFITVLFSLSYSNINEVRGEVDITNVTTVDTIVGEVLSDPNFI